MPSSRYYKGPSKTIMPLKAASVKKGHGLLFGPAGTTSVKYVVIICTAEGMQLNSPLPPSPRPNTVDPYRYLTEILGLSYPIDLHCWRDAGEIRSIPNLRDCQASRMNEQLLMRFIRGPGPTLFTNIGTASLVMSIMLTEQVVKYTSASSA